MIHPAHGIRFGANAGKNAAKSTDVGYIMTELPWPYALNVPSQPTKVGETSGMIWIPSPAPASLSGYLSGKEQPALTQDGWFSTSETVSTPKKPDQ